MDAPRVFVAGTDTGIGKTQVACALLRALAARGLSPAPFKPYESGVQDLDAPSDALALLQAAGTQDSLARICPHRFQAALAPGIAAERLGQPADFRKTLAAFHGFAGRALVAEGAGGLRVPIDANRDVLDLIHALGLPVLLVARAGLGTLNHTALSLDALAARQIRVLAVVLSQSTREVDDSMLDNPKIIARRHGVPVLGPVPFCEDPVLRSRAFDRCLLDLLDLSGLPWSVG